MGPEDVAPILDGAKVEYVLVGLYGLSGWLKEPRATEDVDVLVAKRHHKRAVAAILAAFPDLEVRDTPVVVRFLQGGKAVLDIMKPHHPLFQEALKNTCEVRMKAVKVKVPVLEMALALKFSSMTSLGRQPADKHQDAHDFINVVQNNREINLSRLEAWGELAYPGGGKDLLATVERTRAGQTLEL